MSLFNKYRLGIAIATGVGLLVTLGRCSPIAPSIYRNGFTKPSITQPGVGPGTNVQPASPFVTLVSNSSSKVPQDPQDPTTVSLDSAQLASLRAAGHSTQLQAPAVATQGYILFETSLSDEQLKATSGFQAKLSYQSGVWNLLIPSTVDSSVRDQVLDPANLISVTVTLGH